MPASPGITTTTVAMDWHDGLLPAQRPGHAGHDQGVVACIVILLLGMCLSFSHIRRLCRNMVRQLVTSRPVDSHDTDTGAEKRTSILLVVGTAVFGGLLLTTAVTLTWPVHMMSDFVTTATATGCIAAWIVFQYVACLTVGYTFATQEGRQLWVRNLTASFILLGLVLAVPALTVLFYPAFAVQAVWCAIGLYVVSRLFYICKGFRIFYTNFASLVYFILYLCSLEIIPVIILLFTVRTLCTAGV